MVKPACPGAAARSALSFFFSSRRRHTRLQGDWSSDVCSSDLAVLYTGSRDLQDLVSPLAPFYPYAVFVAGALLGWRFHRSRLLFALLLLTLADRTVLHFAAGHALVRDRVAFQAVGLLLPLNLAALSLTAERGFVTPPGLVRLGLILGQVAAVGILDRSEEHTSELQS